MEKKATNIFYTNTDYDISRAKIVEGKITRDVNKKEDLFFREDISDGKRLSIKKINTRTFIWSNYKALVISVVMLLIAYVVTAPLIAASYAIYVYLYWKFYNPFESKQKLVITYRLIQFLTIILFLISGYIVFGSVGQGVQGAVHTSQTMLLTALISVSLYFSIGTYYKYKNIYEFIQHREAEGGTGVYLWKKQF